MRETLVRVCFKFDLVNRVLSSSNSDQSITFCRKNEVFEQTRTVQHKFDDQKRSK